MGRCYECCQENCGYQANCSCYCHEEPKVNINPNWPPDGKIAPPPPAPPPPPFPKNITVKESDEKNMSAIREKAHAAHNEEILKHTKDVNIILVDTVKYWKDRALEAEEQAKGLNSARIAYASEFDGDVGSIHQNIRELKAKFSASGFENRVDDIIEKNFSTIKILVDDGGMFDGDVYQFSDCFFSNPTPNNIIAWCKDEGYDCTISYKKEQT